MNIPEDRRDEMVRVLCWYPDEEEDLYYAGGWQTGAGGLEHEFVIGICRTPKGRRPSTATDRETFEENVEKVATDVRWLEEAL